MKSKNLFLIVALIAGLGLMPVGPVTAQTFTTVKSFGILTNVTGFYPQSTLVQGPDGTLYGTARVGEGIIRGTVFKLQPDGCSNMSCPSTVRRIPQTRTATR